ncbi:MAG: glutaredoxin family protein [bacterium]|nr:glutaredoxin family protein [bacterium]
MKAFLSHHGVAFEEKVVDEDPAALKELTSKTGMRATPVILIGNETVVGFDRGRLETILGIRE